MEKRLILAIFLSAVVLFIWSSVLPKQQPSPLLLRSEQEPLSSKEILPPEIKKNDLQNVKEMSKKEFNFGHFKAVFNGLTGSLFELKFGKVFGGGNMLLFNALEIVGFNNNFIISESNLINNSIISVSEDREFRIKRILSFKNSVQGNLKFEVENIGSNVRTVNFPVVLGSFDLKQGASDLQYSSVVVSREKNNTTTYAPSKKADFKDVDFIAFKTRYYALIVQSDDSVKINGSISRPDKNVSVVTFSPQSLMELKPGEKKALNLKLFAGPQIIKLLSEADPEYASIIHFGTFDFISQILLQLLEFFHRLFNNWGWAIIGVSCTIFIALFPLTIKQTKSMKEMQMIQPRLEELRKLYKDNPQKFQQEQMKLFREHKVNPLGGCLPLLLQMPVFVAFLQLLPRSIALKGAEFFWIKDLSEPDRIALLPNHLPLLGNEINLLPILMALAMFFQQKISMSKTAGANEQQKMMLFLMPIIFGMAFYRVPSGLVLYWITNSLLMLIYQARVYKNVPA